MISTKSERKPLKSTIWLMDQINRKFKIRSLQNFQTWQFTSLSLRKHQRNGLNGTVKSLNCFLTWEEKLSSNFVVFCWLPMFTAKWDCCVVFRMKCWQKWRARLLEVRRRLPLSFLQFFTWNVEFLQTFAFKFFCRRQTSNFGPNFLVTETLRSRNGFFYANKQKREL